ncbi:hypothetical protein ACGFRG_00150 [Streptomyces sp. NPDC048696]|uniref:hypothetical protein n=1 Tax=Streptomyces sp. NPDC048696 TaxID=3365585 RepID=UPI00371A0E79
MPVGPLRTMLSIAAACWGTLALIAMLVGVPLTWWLAGFGWAGFPLLEFYFAVHGVLAALMFWHTRSGLGTPSAARYGSAMTAWLALPFAWTALRADGPADSSAAWADVFHRSAALAVMLMVISITLLAVSFYPRRDH